VNAFLGRNKIKLKWIYPRETLAFTDKDKDKDNHGYHKAVSQDA